MRALEPAPYFLPTLRSHIKQNIPVCNSRKEGKTEGGREGRREGGREEGDHFVQMIIIQSVDITYMWNLKKKNGANELIYKTEIESQM